MARRASGRTRRGKGRVVQLDFTDVDERVLVDEGKYLCEVKEVEEKEGDKAPYFAWQFEIVERGDFKGATLYHNTSQSEKSLGFLREFLDTLGVDIPDEPFDLDLDDCIGLPIVLEVEHERYEGAKQARVVGWEPAEKDKPSRGRGGKDKEDDRRGRGRKEDERTTRRGRGRKEEPEDETISEDQIKGMNQDELEDVIKDFDLDCDLGDYKTLSKMRAAVVAAAEKAKVLED